VESDPEALDTISVISLLRSHHYARTAGIPICNPPICLSLDDQFHAAALSDPLKCEELTKPQNLGFAIKESMQLELMIGVSVERAISPESATIAGTGIPGVSRQR
jgi:hypothetical protein